MLVMAFKVKTKGWIVIIELETPKENAYGRDNTAESPMTCE